MDSSKIILEEKLYSFIFNVRSQFTHLASCFFCPHIRIWRYFLIFRCSDYLTSPLVIRSSLSLSRIGYSWQMQPMAMFLSLGSGSAKLSLLLRIIFRYSLHSISVHRAYIFWSTDCSLQLNGITYIFLGWIIRSHEPKNPWIWFRVSLSLRIVFRLSRYRIYNPWFTIWWSLGYMSKSRLPSFSTKDPCGGSCPTPLPDSEIACRSSNFC